MAKKQFWDFFHQVSPRPGVRGAFTPALAPPLDISTRFEVKISLQYCAM